MLLRGWLPAEDLRAGDYVRCADGSYGLVHAVAAVAARQPVVNLTVAQAHTFFVGNDGWLVHNAGPREPLSIKRLKIIFGQLGLCPGNYDIATLVEL